MQQKMGIVGAGRIGAAEATLMAGHGCLTTVVGVDDADVKRCQNAIQGNLDELIEAGLATEANKHAILSLITVTTDYQALAGCSFVLEAAFENLEVKHAIYQQVEEIISDDAILASTTSAISADELAATLRHPERFVVAHPFQPAHMVPLVELVGCPSTTPAVMERARTLLESLDREVVTLHKSVPGFIINRFAQALFREAIYLIEQGVVSAEDVDKSVKYAVGMRYASIGLLEYFDDVGFALERDIAETVYPDLCGTQAIQQTVLEGLASGQSGRTAGRGLHDWSQIDDADYLRRKAAPYIACFHWNMPE